MKKYDKNFFLVNFSILIFFILIIIKNFINSCSIEKPILLKNNSCVAQYCTEEQFKNEECKIDNEIIKIQWLNNIICIGEKSFRFINFGLYSNGDIILEITSSPGSTKRIFYGLKQNGRIFFSNYNSYNFSMEVKNQITLDENRKYDNKIFVVKINDINYDNKEYLVSVGNSDQYIELYDFEENEIYQILANDYLESKTENIGTSFNYILDNNNIILFGFLGSVSEINYFHLKLLNFTSKNIDNNNIIISKSISIDNVYGRTLSCFITKLRYIICFYLKLISSKYVPYITAFDEYLNELKIYNFDGTNIYEDDIFFKGIHLDEEIGAFIFYDYLNYIYSPVLHFKIYDFENNIFVNYLQTDNINTIYLNQFKVFNSNYLLNDFIKISYHKICLISVSINKEILYITTINIFGENNAIPKYYYIDLFKLFNYKIFLDLKSSIYKNYVSLSFSFCKNENCLNEGSDEFYSAFLIFSYANSTDYNLNIEKYLFNNNDIKINNIIINLKENITIENNIFGYIYYGIKINNIINCENISLFSMDKNDIINSTYTLDYNEKIKLIFLNNEYKAINCRIDYSYIITDPIYEDRNNYPEMKDPYYGGEESEEIYNSQKELYIGRTTFYYIRK